MPGRLSSGYSAVHPTGPMVWSRSWYWQGVTAFRWPCWQAMASLTPSLMQLRPWQGDDLLRLNACLIAGGMENAVAFLDHLDDMIDGTGKAALPRPLPQAGIYWPQLKAVRWRTSS